MRCRMNYGERMELEARKGKKESVRSAEMRMKGIKEVRGERECVRSREKIAKEIDRKRVYERCKRN